jgi:hypothetical protein
VPAHTDNPSQRRAVTFSDAQPAYPVYRPGGRGLFILIVSYPVCVVGQGRRRRRKSFKIKKNSLSMEKILRSPPRANLRPVNAPVFCWQAQATGQEGASAATASP